jgi:adenosylmethionine-8-amino-7-oxononanoate aminotransferase
MDNSPHASALWRPWIPVTPPVDPLLIVEGRGNRVRDAENNWYLDGIAGATNASCGHGHPRLIESAARQMGQLVHYDLMVASHHPAETLAARLAGVLPGRLNEIFLVNSGSEANEAATRIALQYWRNIGEDRDRVITFEAGYHGCTALTQHLSGLPFTVSEWVPPFPIEHVALPVSPRTLRTAEGADALIARFAGALEAGPPAAAVLVEPLLNIGGCIVLPTGFLTELRRLCDQHGTLLVLDEVFCGFGRTGRMFGFDHDGITPDIVTMSKGISGGYVPLAAVAATSTIKESFGQEPVLQGLRYGHTTGGHAVACAVASTVLDVIADENLVANAAVQGATILAALQDLLSHPVVADIRGVGLVAAIEAESPESAAAIVAAARRERLIMRQQGNLAMVIPPLTITTDEIAEMVSKIRAAVRLSAKETRSVTPKGLS